MLQASTEVDYPYFPFRISVDFVLVNRLDDLANQVQRQLFEKAIRREGLIVHKEQAGGQLFTLLSTPFHRLCREAERRQMSFPLKDCAVTPSIPSCCLPLSQIFVTDDSLRYISAPFQRKYASLLLNYTNEKLFFNSMQRSQLTYEILTKIDISKDFLEVRHEHACSINNSKDSVTLINEEPLQRKGLQYLLMEGAYSDAFILHEPSEEEPYFKKMKGQSVVTYTELIKEIEDDPRKKLQETWCRYFKFQPLNSIRNYFGEQIAFYFAWQGTFVTMLWPAMLLGIFVLVYGVRKSIVNDPANFGNCTVMDFEGETEIVPCKFRDGAAQFFTQVTSWFVKAFDTEINALFAVFMSIWGSIFYQVWRRNNSVLAYQWNCEEFHELEPDRPEFHGSKVKEDPITGESVMFSPNIIRYLKMMCSFLVVILCMSISVISVIAVIMYKMYIVDKYECDKEYTFVCMLLAAFIPSVLNTSSTMLLGFLYNKLVERLNYWENHRTMTEHTNALIIKVFAFSFVNNYVSLFYIAFVRPENHGFQTNGLFGLGKAFKDTCKENTCGSLLALQLMTHMLLKPFPKFSKDVIFPYFIKLFRHKLWFHRRKETFESILKESNETSVLIREWIKPNAGEFALWEFNEKVILFGTTMMFAALFPLAPLFALIFGLVDLRIDAHRLVWFNRRPVPVTTNGIGIWLPILSFIQYAAVMTNAFILAFTSDFCSNFLSDDPSTCSTRKRLLIIIVFQNMVFALKYVLQSIIPTIPTGIQMALRRKRFVIGHVLEKGDVPTRIKHKKKTRIAKLAWITSNRKKNGKRPASVNSTAKNHPFLTPVMKFE